MPDSLRIRPVAIGDLGRILAIAGQVHELVQANRPAHLSAPVEFTSTAETYHELIGHEDVAFLAGAHGEEVLGYALAREERAPDDLITVPYASLDELAVDEQHRRRGAATRLVREVEAWACVRGLRAVHLAVWAFNDAALRLYDGLGYRAIMHKLEKPLG